MTTFIILFYVFFFLCSFYHCASAHSIILENGKRHNRSTRALVHPHSLLSTIEIVNKYDYNGEIHTVKTPDGYFLELHRINGRKNSTTNSKKPAILLMHGILASSSDWVIAGPETGLAFILADQGYDVWMGNCRGNVYSKKHAKLKSYQRKFWDFSWHEMGVTDIPTMIDYIIGKTGSKKIIYIGHSQGTTAFYVMTSERPEYNDKVHLMVSLAPVAFLSKLFSPVLKFVAKFVYALEFVSGILGFHGISPTNKIMSWASSIVCTKHTILQKLCSNLLFMVVGFDADQLDENLLPVIMSHVPAGASVKQFLHFGQNIREKTFRKFDYGLVRNLCKYNSAYPPAYNVSNIQVPVALFYSRNDWLAQPEDVDILHSKLRNPIGKFRIYYEKFNHLDFLWAKDVKKLLYNDLLNLLSRF